MMGWVETIVVFPRARRMLRSSSQAVKIGTTPDRMNRTIHSCRLSPVQLRTNARLIFVVSVRGGLAYYASGSGRWAVVCE